MHADGVRSNRTAMIMSSRPILAAASGSSSCRQGFPVTIRMTRWTVTSAALAR
jgi:hypothetical protein